jgi:hypothetical protein
VGLGPERRAPGALGPEYVITYGFETEAVKAAVEGEVNCSQRRSSSCDSDSWASAHRLSAFRPDRMTEASNAIVKSAGGPARRAIPAPAFENCAGAGSGWDSAQEARPDATGSSIGVDVRLCAHRPSQRAGHGLVRARPQRAVSSTSSMVRHTASHDRSRFSNTHMSRPVARYRPPERSYVISYAKLTTAVPPTTST